MHQRSELSGAWIVVSSYFSWHKRGKVSSRENAKEIFNHVWWSIWYKVEIVSSFLSGMIFKALSWNGLIPISRLTFMAYLIHPFVIWYYYGTTREPITGSPYPMFHNFLAFYLLTYVLSFMVGVLFECPCISLVKMLLEPRNPYPLKTDLKQMSDTSTTKLFSGTTKMPLQNPCLYLKKI